MKRSLLFSAVTLFLVTTATAQVLPPERLPGPGPNGMNFGIRETRGVEAPNDLATIIGIIQADTPEQVHTTGFIPILDVTDPDTNGNGGPILTTPPIPYLTDTAGDDNDIIAIAHGRLSVMEAGDYTIQVRSDDGFGLRFDGIPFSAVHGAGALDSDGSMIFTGGTGDSNSRGVINLPVGEVNVEFVTWERGGGAYYEVTSAKGVFTGPGGAQWLPLGSGDHLDPIPPAPRDVRLVGPANVINGPNATDIPGAIAAARGAILDPDSPRGQTDIVVLKDGGDICCGRPGNDIIDQAVDFPNSDGSDINDFSSGVFGTFLVDNGNGVPDEVIQLTVGLFSDDGSALHIFGEDFLDKGANGELVDFEGDVILQFPDPTGNSNTYGLIELKEGTHGFEAFQYENGGDAGLEIWFATGDHRDNIGGGAFYPLAVDGSVGDGIPGNWGLKAVPEPSSLALLALGLFSAIGVARRRR